MISELIDVNRFVCGDDGLRHGVYERSRCKPVAVMRQPSLESNRRPRVCCDSASTSLIAGVWACRSWANEADMKKIEPTKYVTLSAVSPTAFRYAGTDPNANNAEPVMNSSATALLRLTGLGVMPIARHTVVCGGRLYARARWPVWTVQRMRARQAQTLFVLGHAVHPLCHGRASFHALYDPTLNNSTLLKLGAGHITLGGLSVPANLEHQAKLWTPHAAKITRPSDGMDLPNPGSTGCAPGLDSCVYDLAGNVWR